MRERMREALETAAKNPIRRVHEGPGRPLWPHPPATLHALVRRGWLEYSEIRSRQQNLVQLWSITDEGREALKAPRAQHVEVPQFIARGSGYTSDVRRAADDVETVDKSSLRKITGKALRDWEQRMERQNAERESQDLEDRLARIRAEAADRGVDISRQEVSIRQRIEAIERKVRRKAA